LQQESSGRNAATEGTKVQGDSYRRLGSFWRIILKKKSGRKQQELALKHCLFMPVLCMSNLTTSFRACITKLYASTTPNHSVYQVIKALCSAARDLGTAEYKLKDNIRNGGL